jgi:hypothetical protein
MKRMNIPYILLGVLALCLLAGAPFAAGAGSSGSNGAALQISSHATVPETVYAGSAGQLQITITNSGTDTAAATVVDYQPPNQAQPSEISVGDIGAGSSAIASIPFTVPENVSSGFFTMNLNVVYFGDNTKSAIKNTPLTIAIVVSQHQIMNVKTVSVQPQAIPSGDEVTITLDVENSGGAMNNAVISADGDSTFTLAGATQQTIGDVPSGGSKQVSVALVASSSAVAGKYNVPLVITYQDLLQNTVNQTILVGPVTVSEPSAQFMISMVPVTPAEVGSEAQFALTLTNLAGSGISAIVDLNQESPFTPIGSSRVFFNGIGPGQSDTQNIVVGIAAGTTSGYYNFPLTITSNGRTYNQSIGLKLDATSDVDVSLTTQPQFVSPGSNGVRITAEIANIGNGPMRSVYVSTASTKEFQAVGTTDKFVGTLNIDDFTTFQVLANVPQNLAPGDYSLPISISFKDASNEQRTIVKNATITVYSAQDAGRLNVLSGSAATGTTTGATGTYGGRQAGLFGISYTWIIGGIIVLVLAYFGYKRLKGNKK